MALISPHIDTRKLTLWGYTLPASGTPYARPYDIEVKDLRFTTLAPGGYGDLSCRIKVPNARLVPPELGLMQRVALMGADFPAFLGRWDEPGITLDQQEGDEFELTAQGAANVLQDDPDTVAYSLQTAQYILTQELSRRSAYLPISSDYSAVLPTNPATQFSPVFDGKNVEDVYNELVPVLGDYQWLVWGHPTQRDAAGFPAWQMLAHARDTSTVSYTGYGEDLDNYRVKPAMEYTYNVVQLLYRDISTNTPSSVTVSDSRLAGNGAPGSAPFPRRKLRKDYSAYHLSGAQATALANALLAQYQNGGWKITVVLDRLLDANGREIPLWMCRADTNIVLPQLAPIGAQLPTTPTANTNVFYITETEYSENDGQSPQLTVTCDSFYDKSSFQIARLQYREDHKIRSAKTRQNMTIPGEQATGDFTIYWPPTSGVGDDYAVSVTYGTLLSNTPTSLSRTITASSNYFATFVQAITNQGFWAQAASNAAGSGYVSEHYTTVGA